jgi:chloramphenicol 3-O-phosphotransferase
VPVGPYGGAVTPQVTVLNAGSSSGKSGIARCLQAVLPDPWLALGVDTTRTEALVCARVIAAHVQ